VTEETLLIRKESGIVRLTLNRPDKLNALNAAMYEQLSSALDDIESDPEVRVVIITGTGRAFCAGGDIGELLAACDSVTSAQKRLRKSHSIAGRLRKLKQPVIAMLNGDAIGAGCTLALNADLRIAAEPARLGLTFIRVGLAPDMGGIFNLVKLVGSAKACELAFMGEIISASEAERIGLVNRVVAADQLEEFCEKWAQRLRASSQLVLQLTKAALYKSQVMDFHNELEDEINTQSLCMLSQDGQEGLQAFLDKRKPQFNQ